MATDIAFAVPDDWRGKTIKKVRSLIRHADPEIVEDVKWKTKTNPNGVLVWYRDGMLLTGEIYQKHLRLSFAKGPLLKAHDPKGMINSFRAILLKEEDTLDESGFTELIRSAVKQNQKAK